MSILARTVSSLARLTIGSNSNPFYIRLKRRKVLLIYIRFKETIGQSLFTNKTSLSGTKSLTSDATTSTTTPSSEAEKIASEIPNATADGSEKSTLNTENMSSEANTNAFPVEFHPFQIAGANKL